MRESTVINEWINEGRAEGRAEGRLEASRASLLRILQVRWRLPIPADVSAAIEEQTDLEKLGRWLAVAVTATSLDAFRTAIQQ